MSYRNELLALISEADLLNPEGPFGVNSRKTEDSDSEEDGEGDSGSGSTGAETLPGMPSLPSLTRLDFVLNALTEYTE